MMFSKDAETAQPVTDHFRHIYQHDAERYDRLVSREDQHGNLFDLLMQLLPAGETIVEMGAGTGRLTLMLTFVASQVLACDQSPYMLAVAETKLQQSGHDKLATRCCR